MESSSGAPRIVFPASPSTFVFAQSRHPLPVEFRPCDAAGSEQAGPSEEDKKVPGASGATPTVIDSRRRVASMVIHG